MFRHERMIIGCLASLFLVGFGSALGQTATDIRIDAPDKARSIRVRIHDSGGREVYDSGVVNGLSVQWNARTVMASRCRTAYTKPLLK